MSKNPEFEKEMIEWEKEKWNELLSKINSQLQMIENFINQIAVVLEEYKSNYDLDFECDVKQEIEKIVDKSLT